MDQHLYDHFKCKCIDNKMASEMHVAPQTAPDMPQIKDSRLPPSWIHFHFLA